MIAEVVAMINGKSRHMPGHWWDALEGPKPFLHMGTPMSPPIVSASSNGCTASPDYVRTKDVWPACVVHDWHYSEEAPLGTNWAGRRSADAIFRRNIVWLLREQGMNRFSSSVYGFMYFQAVRKVGGKFYHFEEGEQTEGSNMLSRVREPLGLFVAKT